MTTKTCSKCGIKKELSEFYKHKDHKDGLQSCCKKCKKIIDKNYYENNKEKIHKKSREWKLKNPEKVKISSRKTAKKWRKNNPEKYKQYRIDHPEMVNNSKRQWDKNNIDKLRITRKRNTAKRRRNFGYIPLNERFPGSVGHHISKDLVIFIPEELHKSIPHKYNDPISMGQINILALEYLPEVG